MGTPTATGGSISSSSCKEDRGDGERPDWLTPSAPPPSDPFCSGILCALTGHTAAITDMAAVPPLFLCPPIAREGAFAGSRGAGGGGGGSNSSGSRGADGGGDIAVAAADWALVTQEVMRSTESRAGGRLLTPQLPVLPRSSSSVSLSAAAPPPIIWDGGGGEVGGRSSSPVPQDGACDDAGSDDGASAAALRRPNSRLHLEGCIARGVAAAPPPPPSLLVSGSYDTTLRVWNLSAAGAGVGAGGRCEAVLTGHRSPVWAVTAVDDIIFSADASGSVRVWRLGLEAGEAEEAAAGAAAAGASLGGSSSPSRISSGGGSACRIRWSCIGSWSLPRPAPLSPQLLCLRIVGDVLLTGGGDGAVRAWDALSGRHLWSRPTGEGGSRRGSGGPQQPQSQQQLLLSQVGSAPAATTSGGSTPLVVPTCASPGASPDSSTAAAAAAAAASSTASGSGSPHAYGGSPVGGGGGGGGPPGSSMGAVRRLAVVDDRLYVLNREGELKCFGFGSSGASAGAAASGGGGGGVGAPLCMCSRGYCRCPPACRCKLKQQLLLQQQQSGQAGAQAQTTSEPAATGSPYPGSPWQRV